MVSSESRVDSKDINDHINALLALLLPHQKRLSQLMDQLNAESYFDVLWTSSYLYAGTGPIISQKALRGMSDLRASIGFDIYEDEVDPPDLNEQQ